jgi:hypothetical protein
MSLTFTKTADYPGRITVSFQDQSGASLVASPASLDTTGPGEVRFLTSFDVPTTASSVRMDAVFRANGEGHPVTFMSAAFPVR